MFNESNFFHDSSSSSDDTDLLEKCLNQTMENMGKDMDELVHLISSGDSIFINCSFAEATPEGIWLVKPPKEVAWKILLFLPIIVLSVIGNSLILFILIKHRQTRSSVNIFLGSLAFADLLSTIFISWVGLAIDLTQNYPLGQYCKAESFLKFSFLLASSFSLIVVSADRLKKVVWPFMSSLTTRASLRVSLIIWITAIGIASPVIKMRNLQSRRWKDMEEVWCYERNEVGNRVYYLALLFLLFYLPVVLMLLFYSIILLRMKKWQERLNESGNPVKGRHRKKIIVMLWVYLVASTVCWGPFQVLVFYRYYLKPTPASELPPWFHKMVFIQHLLASLNAAIDPIIYGIVNETFRRALVLHFPFLGRVFGKQTTTTNNKQRMTRQQHLTTKSFKLAFPQTTFSNGHSKSSHSSNQEPSNPFHAHSSKSKSSSPIQTVEMLRIHQGRVAEYDRL